MVYGLKRRDSKRLVSRRKKKRRHPPAFLRLMSSKPHAEKA